MNAVEVKSAQEETSGTPDSAEVISLAFSGGGVRAASEATGVLCTLHRAGLADRVDAISCVSGGGYCGASYCTWKAEQGHTNPDWCGAARAFAVVGARSLSDEPSFGMLWMRCARYGVMSPLSLYAGLCRRRASDYFTNFQRNVGHVCNFEDHRLGCMKWLRGALEALLSVLVFVCCSLPASLVLLAGPSFVFAEVHHYLVYQVVSWDSDELSYWGGAVLAVFVASALVYALSVATGQSLPRTSGFLKVVSHVGIMFGVIMSVVEVSVCVCVCVCVCE
jgi:hypothetical protein